MDLKQVVSSPVKTIRTRVEFIHVVYFFRFIDVVTQNDNSDLSDASTHQFIIS